MASEKATGDLGRDLLQCGCLTSQVFDFIRRCSPRRIAGQPLLAGLEEFFRPAVTEVLHDAFRTTRIFSSAENAAGSECPSTCSAGPLAGHELRRAPPREPWH